MKHILIIIIATLMLLIPYTTNNISYADVDTLYLSINKLLAYPKVALDDKNTLSEINDAEHLTPLEFTNILNALYEDGYILTNLNEKNVPNNKKSLVLIFENLNYFFDTRASGFVDKLIIDKSGNIATYTSKRSINERISYDIDCIPILEAFIKSHPLFSLNGARPIIALNNNDGIFGYKTSKSNATSKYEIKHAIEIANKLRLLGYTFACAGFENESNVLNDLNFASELNIWNTVTNKITGQTNIYIMDAKLDSEYKSKLLRDNGFTLYLSHNQPNYKHIIKLGGKALRESKQLQDLFDTSKIYDHDNRKKLFFTC